MAGRHLLSLPGLPTDPFHYDRTQKEVIQRFAYLLFNMKAATSERGKRGFFYLCCFKEILHHVSRTCNKPEQSGPLIRVPISGPCFFTLTTGDSHPFPSADQNITHCKCLCFSLPTFSLPARCVSIHVQIDDDAGTSRVSFGSIATSVTRSPHNFPATLWRTVSQELLCC